MPNKTRKNGGARHHSTRNLSKHRSSVHRVSGKIIKSSYRKSYKRNMNAKAEAAKPSATARRAAARSLKRNVEQGAMNASAAAAPTVSFAARSRRWHKGPTRHILPHHEPMTNARSKKILEKAKASSKKAEANAKKAANAAHAAKANELANMFSSMGVSNEKKNNA